MKEDISIAIHALTVQWQERIKQHRALATANADNPRFAVFMFTQVMAIRECLIDLETLQAHAIHCSSSK